METNKDKLTISQIDASLNNIAKEYITLPPAKKSIITIPRIFDKQRDENFISDYLAYILHPIKNGIGTGPIKSLLSAVGLENEIIIHDNYSNKEVEVYREYTFKNKNRIDLIILLGHSLLIAVENKIDSYERENQTVDYEKCILDEFKTYIPVFIYLTPRDDDMPSSPNFHQLTYKRLIENLKNILMPHDVHNRIKFLYEEFILHAEEYFMTNTKLEISEKSRLLMKHYKMLEDLQDSFYKDANNIFDEVVSIIKSFYVNNDNEWIFNFSKNREYQQIYKQKWNPTKDIWIHFEFFFSNVSLFLDDEVVFMVDVEGHKSKIENLHKNFEKVYNGFQNEYARSNITYRPKKRPQAVAYKEYQFKLSDENMTHDKIASKFREIYTEFEFLIPAIDAFVKKI